MLTKAQAKDFYTSSLTSLSRLEKEYQDERVVLYKWITSTIGKRIQLEEDIKATLKEDEVFDEETFLLELHKFCEELSKDEYIIQMYGDLGEVGSYYFFEAVKTTSKE